MEPDRPSHTALRVAIARAAHQMRDTPRVFDDPLALRIIGEQATRAIAASTSADRSTYALSLRAFLAARSQYAESKLSSAVATGVRQYVILGAGLDTFAYRNPFPADALRVFEIDMPATQAWKRELLCAASIAVPPTLQFVAIDFTTQTIADRLRATGFDPAAPAFFSWLGVTMYLPPSAVIGTLAHLAGFAAAGSSIVFDYSLPPELMPTAARLAYAAASARVAAVGEPWLSSFDPETLARALLKVDVRVLEDLGPQQINRLFFDGRTDGLRIHGQGHLMHAAL